MKVQTEELTKGVNQAAKELKEWRKQVEDTNKAFKALVWAAGAYLVTKAFVSVTKAASDFSDQVGAVRDQFGEYADDIIKDADRWNTAWGTDRSEFLKGATNINVALKGVGYAAKDAAEMSGHYAMLATDMHARYGIAVTDAANKIKAAITSGGDALADYGVDLSETTVKLKAQAMGMKNLTDKLTDAQAATARVAIIQEKLKDTMGATSKATGDASSATEALKGRFTALMETIGTAFLPLVTRAMTELQVGVEVLAELWGDSSQKIIDEQGKLVKSTDATKDSFSALGETVKFVADTFQAISIAFRFLQSGIMKIISGWVKLFGYIYGGIDKIAEKLTGLKAGTNELLIYGEELDKSIEKIDRSINRDLVKKSWGEQIGEAVKKAREKIEVQRNLAEAKEKAVDPTKFKPEEKPGPTVAPKFASAAVLGSQEAANALIRSRTGGDLGGKDAAKKTAANTDRIAALALQQLGALNKLVGKLAGPAPTAFDDPLARAMMGGF